ncbi:hypothetical protein VIGAN_10188600, partial [Vigna angularis var. angularis]
SYSTIPITILPLTTTTNTFSPSSPPSNVHSHPSYHTFLLFPLFSTKNITHQKQIYNPNPHYVHYHHFPNLGNDQCR